MTLYRYRDRLAYFAHIPKTGGTSVDYALREAGASRGLYSPLIRDGVKLTPQHFHSDLMQSFFDYEFFDFSCAIVRHPFDRLASEYRWQIKLGKCDTHFDQWVTQSLASYESDPFMLDNHIRPQSDFLSIVDRIFRFEDGIEVAIQTLAKKLNLPKVSITERRNSGPNLLLTWADDAVAAARAVYDVDFELLGYDANEVEFPGLTFRD